MASATRETDISVDPEVPMVRITREFDASPDAVFRAHVDPDLLVRWLGPRDVEMVIDHFDCRIGGSYRYVHTRGDQEHGFRGCFHDVRHAELIVQTFTYEGEPDGVALERLTFDGLDGGRCRLTASSLVETFERRDAFVASGMEDGLSEGYEQLDELLART